MKTVPDYPVGKNLLAGKTVLLTAPAGTGVGHVKDPGYLQAKVCLAPSVIEPAICQPTTLQRASHSNGPAG